MNHTFNPVHRCRRNATRSRWFLLTAAILVSTAGLVIPPPAVSEGPSESPSDKELQIETNKKGLGKEVIIRQGPREWYMLVEVSEGNTVVIRQEKNGDTFVMDESETHDDALTKSQVDAAIDAFINGVKAQTKSK